MKIFRSEEHLRIEIPFDDDYTTISSIMFSWLWNILLLL